MIMGSLKIYRTNEGSCNVCGGRADMILEDLDVNEKVFVCAKHYVEKEGAHEIENDLQVIGKWDDYRRWHPDIAREVAQQFHQVADKYGKILRKIIQTQEKRSKHREGLILF